MTKMNGYPMNAKLIGREYGSSMTNNYDFALRKLDRICVALPDDDVKHDFWCSPVFASHFCPNRAYGTLLAAANECGQVILWDMKRNMYKAHHGVTNAHDNAIFDLTWAHKDLKLVTASGDKSVVMWDCRPDLKLQNIHRYSGHTTTAKSSAWNPESSYMFCTGDRGGVVFVWDTRSDKPENVINCAHERERFCKVGKRPQAENTSITGIVFYQANNLITAAAGTPTIRMWDLRKYYAAYSRKPQPVCEFKHDKYKDQSGYSYLTIDPARHRVYATSVYDRIYSFALNTPDYKPASVFVGGMLRSFYAKSCLSPDGNYLVSGSTSKTAIIWNTNQNLGDRIAPVRELLTSGEEVNTVAWCRSSGDRMKIAVFPEGEPCEVYDMNPPTDSSDCGALEAEKSSRCNQEVSKMKSELPNTVRRNKKYMFSLIMPGKHSESDMACPVLGKQNRSNLGNSTAPNRKRVLHEMLGNDSEDRQNKKIKQRGILCPRRLFAGADILNVDEKGEGSSVSFKSINRCDENDKNYSLNATCCNLLPLEDERNITASDSHVKSPFSPTSNLPNHVVDGTSPSHVCKPHREKRLDWLTELRHEKATEENNTQSKLVIESSSRKNDHVKKQHKKRHESILKFFRVLGKSTDEQLKSSQGCRVVTNS